VRAIGPNEGKPIAVIIGGQTKYFRVGFSPQIIKIKFTNILNSHDIVFVPFQPTIGRTLDRSSNDYRALGIGLLDLTVIPLSN
jgi:hypothetical protein